MASESPVGDLLRIEDPDRYFATLFAPVRKRRDLQAVYAFDAEVGSIRSKIREPMAGEIRLQWWHDALSTEVGVATGNPLADEVRAVIRSSNLPVSAFGSYLEARTFDFYDDGMPGRVEFEAYAGETTGTILQLGALVLEPETARLAADACGHGACLIEIARLLDRLGRPEAARTYIPGDLLEAAGQARDDLGKDEASLRAITSGLLAMAREHHAAFVGAVASLPASVMPALLPVAPALLSVRLRERGARPPGRLRRQWSILRAAMKGWR